MPGWAEVKVWRRAKRAELLARRAAVPSAEKRTATAAIVGLIQENVPDLHRQRIGFYWPIKGELALAKPVGEAVAAGASAALPVVVEKNAPVEFWDWRPGMPMRPGFWGIPIPAERRPVAPTLLLVPLVGFDGRGYRLGYGGGYYDRSLAATTPRPLAVGLGYAFARLDTIHPQPHDIPMDAIVTEAGFRWFDRAGDEPEGYASPPCLRHEIDPAYPDLER